MLPFIGGQAITNRTKFYDALRKLEDCDSFTHYLIELSVIVSGLRPRPVGALLIRPA